MRIWPQEKKNTGAPTSSFNHAAIKHQKRPPTIDEDPRASSRVNTWDSISSDDESEANVRSNYDKKGN